VDTAAHADFRRVLSAVVMVFIAWNVGLRRRVRAQTRVIRTQLEEADTLRLQAEAAHREKEQIPRRFLSRSTTCSWRRKSSAIRPRTMCSPACQPRRSA